MQEKKYCRNCGAEVPKETKFCPSCGSKFEQAPSTPGFCTKCGASLPNNVRFCTRCGAPVAGTAQPGKVNRRIPPAASVRPPHGIPEQNKTEKWFLQKSICLWYDMWSSPKKQKKKTRLSSWCLSGFRRCNRVSVERFRFFVR